MEEGKEVKPKTVPAHFTPVATASQAEVIRPFGPEERKVGGKTSHSSNIGRR